MIIGIGIDSIEIERFVHFYSYTKKLLEKTFSSTEIAYCLKHKIKSAERFAARFAAKEAFYKAFCTAFPEILLPSRQIFNITSLEHQTNGHINLIVDWQGILRLTGKKLPLINTQLSLTHTKTVATAIVILEKN